MDWTYSDTMSVVSGLNSLSNSISDYKAAVEAGEYGLASVRETNEANKEIARMTNEANLDLYRMQFDDALKLQSHNEFYNSPAHQVQLLRDAGLNPALTFGKGSSAGSVALPSAAPAVSPVIESTPYEVYRDLATRPVANMVSDMLSSMEGIERVKSQQIDNMTKDAYNRAQISEMIQRIDNLLDSKKTSGRQRDLLVQQKNALEIANRLFSDTYNDKIEQSDLQTKFMELTNKSVDAKLANDAASLAIQRYEAETHRRLSDAQIENIGIMANLAISADWRSEQQHIQNMNLQRLDELLKKSQLSEEQKNAVFNDIMRESEKIHTELKDASLINKLAERAFGLGFRDIGTALRSLFTK